MKRTQTTCLTCHHASHITTDDFTTVVVCNYLVPTSHQGCPTHASANFRGKDASGDQHPSRGVQIGLRQKIRHLAADITLQVRVLLSLLTRSSEGNEELMTPNVEKNCSRAIERVLSRLQSIAFVLTMPGSACKHRINKSMAVVIIRFGESSPITTRSLTDNSREPCCGGIQFF